MPRTVCLDGFDRGGAFNFGIVRVGFAFCVAQSERTKPVGISLNGSQCNVAPHGKADDHRFTDAEMIQKTDEVIHKQLNRVLAIADLAVTVAADIVRDHTVRRCKRLRLSAGECPHPVAKREAVNKDDRRCSRNPDIDIVQERIIDGCFHSVIFVFQSE